MTKLRRLQRKCDKALQECNRDANDYCEYCGRECTVGHHFFAKSMASALRYDIKNIIPLCAGCHLRHHMGDPRIHATILIKRGDEWWKDLIRRKEAVTKVSQKYYKEILNQYERL